MQSNQNFGTAIFITALIVAFMASINETIIKHTYFANPSKTDI
jgi:hypothetical protein